MFTIQTRISNNRNLNDLLLLLFSHAFFVSAHSYRLDAEKAASVLLPANAELCEHILFGWQFEWVDVHQPSFEHISVRFLCGCDFVAYIVWFDLIPVCRVRTIIMNCGVSEFVFIVFELLLLQVLYWVLFFFFIRYAIHGDFFASCVLSVSHIRIMSDITIFFCLLESHSWVNSL